LNVAVLKVKGLTYYLQLRW